MLDILKLLWEYKDSYTQIIQITFKMQVWVFQTQVFI